MDWLLSLPLLGSALAAAVFCWKFLQSQKLKAKAEANLQTASARVRELEYELQQLEETAQRRAENSIRKPENQIKAVHDPDVEFSTRPVMNRGEFRLFRAAKRALGSVGRQNWHVFPQVSLGEVLKVYSHREWISNRAHQSINSKRCDILIADDNGKPVIVVEYQGSGHYQGDAESRDSIKCAAVTRAGIKYIEFDGNCTDEGMFRTISNALKQK
ncbi:DUF2726 domain-containing protein [Falsiroseomonas sp. HC035]|uniref:DUF2726 domain-containing protein n=1 Tax=Falsiroseomonas sp. HC035 TaxID=3390999 RepID=UPI003D318686